MVEPKPSDDAPSSQEKETDDLVPEKEPAEKKDKDPVGEEDNVSALLESLSKTERKQVFDKLKIEFGGGLDENKKWTMEELMNE